ncbi:MAG: hypothetical protein FWE09_02415, partial [Treponema sp.]|nr:hypothetical protein [Treponema sp.]
FDRFSFEGPSEAMFDILVYNGVYSSVEAMMRDVVARLGNTGNETLFEYSGRDAGIMELRFAGMEGWALGLELDGSGWLVPPLLLALAYAPAGTENVDLIHISALNSIAPTDAEALLPGPIVEFAIPRGDPVRKPLAGSLGLSAMFRENDASAAQMLVDNEFLLLSLYQFSRYWQEAWIRFYRAIFRDSWDRISDAAFQLERALRLGAQESRALDPGERDRVFAQRALSFVQGFAYERDRAGSDFVNLVSAITEGRGDCDSRAMLWATVLSQANIPAGIMVSREYSHAMGLADLPGPGARFESAGVRWLVAETTARIDIGLIDAEQSVTENWLGVTFE